MTDEHHHDDLISDSTALTSAAIYSGLPAPRCQVAVLKKIPFTNSPDPAISLCCELHSFLRSCSHNQLIFITLIVLQASRHQKVIVLLHSVSKLSKIRLCLLLRTLLPAGRGFSRNVAKPQAPSAPRTPRASHHTVRKLKIARSLFPANISTALSCPCQTSSKWPVSLILPRPAPQSPRATAV